MRAVDNFELIRRFVHFESTDQFYFMQILQLKKTVKIKLLGRTICEGTSCS